MSRSPQGRIGVVALSLLIAGTLVVLAILLSWYSHLRVTETEVLISVKPDDVSDLLQPRAPDPQHTGIPSLDSLNRKWNVQHMLAVYPDVLADDEIAVKYGLAGVYKLTVPQGTNVAAMIKEYEANPHIVYAELNKPVQINE